MVGFGVKSPDMAAAVAEVADGVIVATALIDRFEAMRGSNDTKAFDRSAARLVADYRAAIDG